MRLLPRIFAFFLIATIVACSSPSREELASLAAKGFYEHLIRGEYESFLEGVYGSDSLPDDYKAELLDNYRMYMHRIQQYHNGIREVRISNAKADSSLHYMNVFLVLCFGDSVNEEVLVPMVEHQGSWRMK